MANHGTQEPDQEEARLKTILMECSDRMVAAFHALSHRNRSLLLPEYKKLHDDAQTARAEYEKSKEALREYRARRSGPS